MAREIRIDGRLTESRKKDGTPVLRRRLSHDGYVLLKDFFPSTLIEEARQAALGIFSDFGMLHEGAKFGQARLKAGLTHAPLKPRLLAKIQTFGPKFSATRIFKRVMHYPSLAPLCTSILGGKIVSHPRRMAQWARVHFPSTVCPAMEPHQDFHFVGVPQETYSIWIPMSDCPLYLGGIAVLKGSHRLGRLRHNRNCKAALPSSLAKKWLSTDFEIGDVLIFSSLLVHGPLPNRTLDTLRFAFDFRFCRYDLFEDELLQDPDFGQL